MTKGAVDRQLKIYARMSADDRIVKVLDQLESMYGRKHGLATSAALDVLCNRSAVKGNIAQQTALTLFLVEAVAVLHARQDIPADISRDTLGSKVIPQILLKRRVMYYLFIRFKFADPAGGGGRAPHDVPPSKVIPAIFGSFVTFHKQFPKGRDLSDIPSSVDKESCREPDGHAWLAPLLQCHQQLVEFLKDLLLLS